MKFNVKPALHSILVYMKRYIVSMVVIAATIGTFTLLANSESNEQPQTNQTTTNTSPLASNRAYEYSNSTEVTIPTGKEIATFAGGCFWCVEAVFQETQGVDDVISGYAGGTEAEPSYEDVTKGLTTHREAIQFTYDPAKITYDEILDIFWQSIDPTDAGGQFVDRGFIYTTAVYYHDEAQRQTAIGSVEELRQGRDYTDQIATELLPFTTFYPAEDYHQDYYKKASENYKRYESGSGREEYKNSIL